VNAHQSVCSCVHSCTNVSITIYKCSNFVETIDLLELSCFLVNGEV
jgi:hypothetical protein